MAYADTFSGEIVAQLRPKITTTEGGVYGDRYANHDVKKVLVDGTSTGQAQGFFSTTFTATTGGITVSLADSADPLGAAGDDTPTMDPEGLKLRAIMVENLDSTNYVTLAPGTNGITSWIGGTSPTVRVPAGGMLLASFPAGLDAMNDGADDEITVTANTASCSVKISYIFG